MSCFFHCLIVLLETDTFQYRNDTWNIKLFILLMNRKKEHLFEIEIINVFSVTFDQINATLLNKILKKKLFNSRVYSDV